MAKTGKKTKAVSTPAAIDWAAIFSLDEPVKTRAAKALGQVAGVPWSSEAEETSLTLAQFTSEESVDQALGVAARAVVENDPAIFGRASARVLSEALLTQANREAIIIKAATQLIERTPNAAAGEGLIDDGWLLTFAARAERTTDPMLQNVWAAALCAEILEPGKVSTILLDSLHKLGSRELGLINKYAGLVLGEEFIPVPPGDLRHLKALFELQALGYVHGTGTRFSREGQLDESGLFWVLFAEEALLVKGGPGAGWSLPGVFASQTLSEISEILDIRPGRDAMINAAKLFLDQPRELKVMRASWAREDNRMRFEPVEIYHRTPPEGVDVERVE